jgi:hypothetical protein
MSTHKTAHPPVNHNGKRHRKKPIPKALREALWIKYHGQTFRAKCLTSWCPNTVTAYDFQAGHNVPESKGGPTTLENLRPICARCNGSMNNNYTFDQWDMLCGPRSKRTWREWFCCSGPLPIAPHPVASVLPNPVGPSSKLPTP